MDASLARRPVARRMWVFWLIVAAAVWFVLSRLNEIRALAATLGQGDWQWLAAAAALQALYFLVLAALYHAAFAAVGVASQLRDLLPLTFSALFVNVVAPTGGASGTALFADYAARRGQSAARAAAGVLLVLVANFGAFTLVLALGLLYLFQRHSLQPYQVVASAILLCFTLALSLALSLGLWSPRGLRRLLAAVQRAAGGLGRLVRRPGFLADDWGERTADELIGAATNLRRQPRELARTLGLATVLHGINLLCLYLLFRAFQQSIPFAPLVAGYAIAILFWIVSPTPQGIGVVEGVMALVYTTLGVPAPVATLIALAFRGLSFWLPLAIGFVWLRRAQGFSGEASAASEVWSVRLVALLTAAMGVINVLSAIRPAMAARVPWLEQFSPLAVRHGTRLATALAGFALFVLADGLARRKHVAWLLTIGVLLLSIVGHLVKGLDYEEALLAAGLAAWLVLLQPHFHARSDPPSIRQGLRALLAALSFTLVYGAAGFYMLDRHFSVNFGLLAALRQTLAMFVVFYDPSLQPVTRFGRYFLDSIYLVGAATLAYALFMVVRPVLLRQPASSAERARARAIVSAHGRSPLAHMALFDDKAYFFSRAGSVVAFVARGRAAVALGEPVGPAGDLARAVREYGEFCALNDWVPAFYLVPPDRLEAYRGAGYRALCVGREAIVDLAAFSLDGGANKPVRTMVNRLTRLGHTTHMHAPPLPDELLDRLSLVSDEWLTLVKGREMRFSMGWFYRDYLRECQVMTVCAPDGGLRAFANLLPAYQHEEIAVDLMRYGPAAEKGSMEFLFVRLFEWARAQGYARFNLGLSALSGVGEQADDPAVERALHYFFEHVNQFYNFKGLYAFKDKYHPEWSPRYLLYPNATHLPGIAATLIRADSGDDFVLAYLRK